MMLSQLEIKNRKKMPRYPLWMHTCQYGFSAYHQCDYGTMRNIQSVYNNTRKTFSLLHTTPHPPRKQKNTLNNDITDRPRLACKRYAEAPTHKGVVCHMRSAYTSLYRKHR